jgi:hypothetical protein
VSGEKRNADRTLTVPDRAEGPGGMIGDGMITIGPDDPRYAVWDRYLTRAGELSRPPDDMANGNTITGQNLELTGDGHGHHVPGTPDEWRHGYIPLTPAAPPGG